MFIHICFPLTIRHDVGFAIAQWSSIALRSSTGRFSDLALVEKAGTPSVELLNWLAMRGAVSAGGASVKVHGNYHIPISKTATGLLALEVA